jgi:hypothetical protein
MISGRKSLIAVMFTAAALLLPGAASAANTSGPVRPCNGSVELCARSFDQVVLPGSHNSMAAEELGFFRPNQTYSIPNQLRRGARAMLIDTYYGRERKLPNGETVVDNVRPTPPDTSDLDMYLCHEFCGWGASELDFLAANPREVMVFVNQDAVKPADYARAVEESGLLDFVYTGPTDEWPTLEEMVDSGQRVLMLSESGSGGVDWYHPAYSGIMKETPYTFRAWSDLFVPELLNRSCRPLRGGENGSMFLMNNWTTVGLDPPGIRDARIVNSRSSLVRRAEACESRRGSMPTILAVDFFGTGDVVGAARELNGVEAAPFFELQRPRAVRVRAGQPASFRMRISNFGDATASGLWLCAIAPRRLAARTACRTVNGLAPNSAQTVTLPVRTKRTARGRGPVSVVLSTALTPQPLSTTTNLTVQPLRRPRGR